MCDYTYILYILHTYRPVLTLIGLVFNSVLPVKCVFSSHLFRTSSSFDVPAGVTQVEGHTGCLIHLPSAVHAFIIFLARRIQPLLSLVDREIELSLCVVVVVVVVVFTLKTVLTSIQYPSLSYSSRQRNEFPWSHANPK